MICTQKEIYEYLSNNPLGVTCNVGELEDLNGLDYIFLDYYNQELIGYDDKGTYQTMYEITVATRDFDDCMLLLRYVQDKFNVDVRFNKSTDFEYYLAQCQGGLILYAEDEN